MSTYCDIDLPSDIRLFARKVDPTVDELLIGLHDVFEVAKGILLDSSSATIDFETLLKRSIEKIPRKTESELKTREVLGELPAALGDMGLDRFEPGSEDREAAAVKWLSKKTEELMTILIGRTVGEPVDVAAIKVPQDIQPFLKHGKEIENLWCYEYALMRVGEKRIFEVEEEDQYNIGDIPGLMRMWGYASVERPMPGDLVLFLSDENFEPTHLGIYRGQGRVESKWWNSLPVPYLHRLEDTPSIYGKGIVIYRPPPAAPGVMHKPESLKV